MNLEIEKINTITNEYLNKIDLSKYDKILDIDPEYKNYFYSESGREHYRLLVYISNLFNKINILDIGTNRGFSAIALSDNKNNTVVSYDLIRYESVKSLMSYDTLSNIEFKLGNCIELEDFNKYKVIMLDTLHDGIFEKQVFNHLRLINWKGIILMDDIETFPLLASMWKEIKEKKYILTSIGHASGTGMVIFKGE